MDFRVIGERPDLRLDGGENARDLFERTAPIIGREDPQGHGRHGEFTAPVEHIIELARAQ